MAVVLLALTLIAGATRIVQYARSPSVVFLSSRGTAKWIKVGTEFNLRARAPRETRCLFRCQFTTTTPVQEPRIIVRAVQQCEVVLDGGRRFSPPSETVLWKEDWELSIPRTVPPGVHELLAIVTARDSHPSFLCHSPALDLQTDSGWTVSLDGQSWEQVALAADPPPPRESLAFPSVREATPRALPVLAIVFALAWGLGSRSTLPKSLGPLTDLGAPSVARALLLLLWVVRSFNNLLKLDTNVGFDVHAHVDYIRFISSNHALPLASDGWQMFQSPLYYMINAPLYSALIAVFDQTLVVKLLRIIPICCGALLIEVVYRCAALAFPRRKDLQILATLFGTMVPMHTYICQVIGNEPMAGALISLVLFGCLKLVVTPEVPRRASFFALLGLTWGAALLTKIGAVLLAPTLLGAVVFAATSTATPWRKALRDISLVVGVTVASSGWYFLRNWLEFGQLFVSGWAPTRGITWWQDPGYRTWSQLLTFGRCLGRPVYSGATSLWDGLYSTLWLDGFHSGVVSPEFPPPWNALFVTIGSAMALIPTFLILAGGIRSLVARPSRAGRAALLSCLTLTVFLGAVVDLYIRLPVYGTGKATYTLGALPCYAVLLAFGAERFTHCPKTSSALRAGMAAWACAAYVAYFVLGGS